MAWTLRVLHLKSVGDAPGNLGSEAALRPNPTPAVTLSLTTARLPTGPTPLPQRPLGPAPRPARHGWGGPRRPPSPAPSLRSCHRRRVPPVCCPRAAHVPSVRRVRPVWHPCTAHVPPMCPAPPVCPVPCPGRTRRPLPAPGHVGVSDSFVAESPQSPGFCSCVLFLRHVLSLACVTHVRPPSGLAYPKNVVLTASLRP